MTFVKLMSWFGGYHSVVLLILFEMTQAPSSAPAPAPIPLGQPLPHRKIIREWLAPLVERRTATGVALLFLDLVLFSALMVGTVAFLALWAKFLYAVAAGFMIGRFLIIGHHS